MKYEFTENTLILINWIYKGCRLATGEFLRFICEFNTPDGTVTYSKDLTEVNEGTEGEDGEFYLVVDSKQEKILPGRYTFDLLHMLDTGSSVSLVNKESGEIEIVPGASGKQELYSAKQIYSGLPGGTKDYRRLSNLPTVGGEPVVGEIFDNNKLCDEEPAEGSNRFISSGAVYAAMNKRVRVHFPFRGYDTGDCTIIETEKHIIMIDCGEMVENVSGNKSSTDILIEYMVANKLTKIDYFIVSHFHSDHLGGHQSYKPDGLDKIFSDNRINTATTKCILPHKGIDYSKFLGYSGSTPTAKTLESKVKELCTGERSYYYPVDNEELSVDDCLLTFHNIGANYYEAYYAITDGTMNEAYTKTRYNNFSMVVQMRHGNNRFLFTGDIDKAAQELLVDVIDNPDVVKIEHHGLNYSTNDDYLNVIAPKYAVVMEYDVHIDGDTERRETFNKARLTGTVFSSNLNGNVVIVSQNNTLAATAERGNANELHYRTLDSAKGLRYNDDLNNITKPGEYFSWDTKLTATLKNCVIKEGSFKLIVELLSIGQKSGVRQTIIIDGDYDAAVYSRAQSGYNSTTWSPWSCESPLAKAITLSEGTDLNDCLDNVTYRAVDGALAATLKNAPEGLDSKIKVINHALGSADVKQIIITSNSKNQVFYTRYAHRTDSSKNSSWYRFEGFKEIPDVKHFVRVLTAEDDLNNLVEPGVYYHNTSSMPANAAFSNAAVIEVVESGSAETRVIQRATRYGIAGCTAFRVLYNGKWLDWTYPLVNKNNANSTAADYVVGEGTSGKWTYRKWASGVAEAWGTVTITLTNDAYEIASGLHCCAGRGTLPADVFTSVKNVLVAPLYSYQTGASGRVKSDMTFECNMFGLSANLSSMKKSGQYDINCEIKGTWK